MFGILRPEFKSGSDEPETSEAAVAAVATLKIYTTVHVSKPNKLNE